MSSGIAKVTARGQVTIPRAVRRSLGIEEKDRVLFVVAGERAILIPLKGRSLAEFNRTLPATRPYPGMQEIRKTIQQELGERMGQGEIDS